MGIKISLLVLY